MRLTFLILLTGVNFQTCYGQTVNNFNQSIMVEAFDINGASMMSLKKMNIEGTPYVNDNWQLGSVLFTNGRKANKISIRYDLNKQLLQFRQDSITYTFSDPVKEFMLPANDALNQQVLVFRCGYPINGHLSSAFFYNVLYAGKKFDLVKSVLCRLYDKYQYIGSSSQQYQHAEELYLFDIEKQKFTKIKKGKPKSLGQFNANQTDAKTFFEKTSMESERDFAQWVMLLDK